MYNLTVEYQGERLSYEDLCARWADYCYDNEVLRLSSIIPMVQTGEVNLTYPVYFDPYNFEVSLIVAIKSVEVVGITFCFCPLQTFPLAAFFGGVTLTDLNTLTDVKSVGLSYFLDQSEEWMVEVGDEWERGFLRDLQTLGKVFAPNLEVRKIC